PFLCFVGLSLWWMERCRIRGILTTRTRDLVVLGLLLAFTLNIRREGVALIPALVALHLTVLVPIVRRARSVRVLTKDLAAGGDPVRLSGRRRHRVPTG